MMLIVWVWFLPGFWVATSWLEQCRTHSSKTAQICRFLNYTHHWIQYLLIWILICFAFFPWRSMTNACKFMTCMTLTEYTSMRFDLSALKHNNMPVINFDFKKNRFLLSSSLHCSLTADSTAFNFVMLIFYASWFPVSPPFKVSQCLVMQ